MQLDRDDIAWLDRLPLNEPVEIDGITVCLRVQTTGAELEAVLLPDYLPYQLRAALQQGFSSALVYDAGLGLTPDGKSLSLSQWLPGLHSWSGAAPALEKLLNQVDVWRNVIGLDGSDEKPEGNESPIPSPMKYEDRHERRLRKLIASKK